MVNHATSYTNHTIVYVELLLWRFYSVFFHYFGLMRHQYDRSQNKVTLTYYSVTIANMVGLFLVCVLCRDLPINGMQLGFVISLLLQPRSVFEKRIRLINKILRISPHLFYRYDRKFHINGTLPFTSFIKFTYLDEMMSGEDNSKIFILIGGKILTSKVSNYIIYISCMLMSSTISLIFKYIEFVNKEIATIVKRLPVAILRMEHRAVSRMKRRLILMQNLKKMCSQIIEMIFECLGSQLLFLMYFNVSFLFTLQFKYQRAIVINIICGMSLHTFLRSLGQLITMYGTNIVNNQVTPMYDFDEFRSNHNWMQKTFSTWRTEDWSELINQDSMHHLLKARLKVLGLFAPNERLLFNIVFAYCTIAYLKIMWEQAALKSGNNKLPFESKLIIHHFIAA
ncbi:uncharacterized protein LOC116656041 [Drosophila ananassae]|uniref:uncharacterized protein LOC116656041 n=1 Tax=Drosophila ananassae TaxID=7217 RepID=UPI0013A5C586|nr:uncharacterized protein LOC116656041 [Drosophila ananassae]